MVRSRPADRSLPWDQFYTGRPLNRHRNQQRINPSLGLASNKQKINLFWRIRSFRRDNTTYATACLVSGHFDWRPVGRVNKLEVRLWPKIVSVTSLCNEEKDHVDENYLLKNLATAHCRVNCAIYPHIQFYLICCLKIKQMTKVSCKVRHL